MHSGQSCSYAALQCQSDLSRLISIQKRAVLMYSDEKLLFYDLFIKSLIENWCGVCPVVIPSGKVTRCLQVSKQDLGQTGSWGILQLWAWSEQHWLKLVDAV